MIIVAGETTITIAEAAAMGVAITTAVVITANPVEIHTLL
ncbi:hypothetical protein PG5_35770 [Pseudomonas sp. G5(2012)]|jgi:hypothetical protein|nr:hypothetical protein PG5_35770 [Pseudomonas sp. G5(2012)]